MMRLFPNGFGGFDLVEEDGLLGLGGLVGGFFKVICLLFVVAIPPFILGNLPGDLRTLWEADWLDWPAWGCPSGGKQQVLALHFHSPFRPRRRMQYPCREAVLWMSWKKRKKKRKPGRLFRKGMPRLL